MIPNILTVIFISLGFAFLFLWAWISGTLMIEALREDIIVRDFTIIGGGLGAVIGVVGLWLRAKGKRTER